MSESLREKWRKTWMKFAKNIPEVMPILPMILNEFVDLAADRCEKCVSDRIICYLKPLCPQRIILEILIRLGVPTDSLPELCYKRYLSAFKDIFTNTPTEEYYNRTAYASDFLALLGQGVKNAYDSGDSHKFIKSLTKTIGKYYTFLSTEISKNGKRIWILANERLLMFDMGKNLVVIEPDGPIKSSEIFEELIMLFTKTYELNYEGEEEYKDVWIYRFFFPPNTPLGDTMDKLQELTGYASWYSDEKRTTISVEFMIATLTIQKLKKVLLLLAKLRK